jgi:hypothetical protein
MSISFYEASVENYLQTLAATQGFLEKGLAYCKEMEVDPEEIVERRVFADMNPFRFQIHQVVSHSQGAIEAMKAGVLRVPAERERPKSTYAELQSLIADAHAALTKIKPAEIDGLEDRDIVFEVRDSKRVFTCKGFLFSFSLPNFYFHATTAYDILRGRGVPIGKRDFMGQLRLKT